MVKIATVLEIKNVTKRFGKKTVVDDLSFSVNEGEIMGFLGPNGAGKTTLIKMAMGLLKITSGTISVCGYDIKEDYEKAAQNFGGIIENPEMYSELKGITNIEVFSELYNNVDKKRIEEVIELVGLKDRINDPIKKYSLGMRQRIGVAQAIIHNPKLLILDEPTNGLDPAGIKELRDMLKNLAKTGTGVLVSSHLLSEMELMCDRVCIIDKGKMIDIKDLKSENKKGQETENGIVFEYVYDTDNNNKAIQKLKEKGIETLIKDDEIHLQATKNEIGEINKRLMQEGITIYTVTKKSKSLEDVFMEKTKKLGKEV